MKLIKANGCNAKLDPVLSVRQLNAKIAAMVQEIYRIDKVPEIPVYSNCRCSVAETIPEKGLQFTHKNSNSLRF